VTFDPFFDFEDRGYLRNYHGLKDPVQVARLQHMHFTSNVENAFSYLRGRGEIEYADLLKVHGILFKDFYPWAGKDRLETTPDLLITKGPVEFAHPTQIESAAAYGLSRGNNRYIMAEAPGDVMGYLAHAHPFLDGNGRALMTVHTELAQRAGISIDWPATDRNKYLAALTQELDNPGKGKLDAYLRPFIRDAIAEDRLGDGLMRVRGLAGHHAEKDSSEKDRSGRGR